MSEPHTHHLARFRASEISARRVAQAIWRRIEEVPHAAAWARRGGVANLNRSRVGKLRGRHTGERCFIIGNGPSLRSMDLAPLAHEATFGLNRIYLLFDQIPFQPTYFVCINELVLEQYAHEIRALPMPKFLNWNRRALFDPGDETALYLRLRLGLRDGFATDLRQSVFSGGTVTFAAMQVAYYLGFRQVILIGVDHAYRDRGVPNTPAVRTQAQDADHFHPDYFPKGSRWQPPDLLRSEVAYAAARHAFETDGREILDATVGGQCPVFEKVGFESLFASKRDRGST